MQNSRTNNILNYESLQNSVLSESYPLNKVPSIKLPLQQGRRKSESHIREVAPDLSWLHLQAGATQSPRGSTKNDKKEMD